MGNDVSCVDVLRNTPFAMFLSPEVVQDISVCFTPIKFKPGATIAFTKQEFLIVARGSVDVSTILPHAQKKVKVMELLCKKRVGDIVTHCATRTSRSKLHRKSYIEQHERRYSGGKKFALMLDLVTVTADPADGCVLLRLNRDKFVRVRALHMMHRPNVTTQFSINKATRTAEDDWRLVTTVADDQIADYLAGVPFFSDVKSSRLVALAGLCTYMVARKDEVVCKENDLGDKFYICITGVLAVTVENDVDAVPKVSHRSMSIVAGSQFRRSVDSHRPSVSMSQVLIRRIADGSYFGEISLILNMKRSATVTAVDDSLLVYIDARAFRNFLKVCPDVRMQIEQVIISRLLQIASKSSTATFLAAMSMENHQRLAQLGQLLEVARGTKLIVHHDDPVFYIVLNGKVEVDYDLPSGHLFVALGPGGYLNELSMILQTGSLIQATVREDSVLLALHSIQFHMFFSTLPEFFAEFSLRYLQHDASLEHVINHYDAHELWLVYLEGRPDSYEERIRHITNGVLFCEDADEFTMSCESLSREARVEQAKQVVEMYFDKGCERPVALSRSLREDIYAAIEASSIDDTLFSHARREIIDLMDASVLADFKRSTKFASVLTKLVCLPDIPVHLSSAMKAHLNFHVFKHRPSHAVTNNYAWVSATPR
ncbi:hypothetical protein H310_07472 [Aphanomyces invadans]|uniref:Cyclic nucleotide-binding domain-containing protein n=1 Tax=Aphanomyces invadans TaxID=157072 RepID=A0A024U0T9_9STRA|nr:hypothetical protein H310_07472 [Aphanomyces invadans]ETW00036.1 hypothetical protein H310_07472 [Aphanomyces invadans]|eukprot:XP_008871061.1 hypothetical protein H310_07472 [Aphanomyces invadans]